ncbi:flagellar basal body P-ring formation chaperone FlgA [Sodalis sp. C49]|uniref:flagellar basal body P-ring formation chaperone FlgA n=1 Tax=Sodalis sp. C49 TaxID=3228929 RepID=UPI003965D5A6
MSGQNRQQPEGEPTRAPAGGAWRMAARRIANGFLYGMAGALLLSTGARAADRLTEGLTDFLLRQYASPPVELKVVVKTPAARRPDCEQPQFSLPANNRARGNISVQVICGNQKRYVQAEVQVTDRYLVTARAISANQTLAQGDVVWQTGRVDNMSVTPLTDMAWVYGSLSERALGSGQVLTAAMLRRPWLVKTGQPVQVTAQGDGFSVQGTGKAMGNAAVNDRLRVRMESGQMVVGQVTPDGGIRIEP